MPSRNRYQCWVCGEWFRWVWRTWTARDGRVFSHPNSLAEHIATTGHVLARDDDYGDDMDWVYDAYNAFDLSDMGYYGAD